jgi:hypothetical protein
LQKKKKQKNKKQEEEKKVENDVARERPQLVGLYLNNFYVIIIFFLSISLFIYLFILTGYMPYLLFGISRLL